MNMTDQIDSVEIMRNPKTQREKILVEALWLAIDEQELDHRLVFEEQDCRINYLEEQLEEAEGKINEREDDYSRLKKEVRELRKKSHPVLRERIADLEMRLEMQVQNAKEQRLTADKANDWNLSLRESLNKKTSEFYRDMNRMLSELEKAKKSKIRILTVHNGKHPKIEPSIRGIKRRWLVEKTG